MNAPPPPPRSPPTSSEEPTTYQSLPAPASVPIVSFRVPSSTPGAPSVPIEFTGPPGTQLSIPGLPAPAWKWLTAHGTQILIATLSFVLLALGKVNQSFVETIWALLIGAQLPPIRVDGDRQVIAAAPAAVSPPPTKGTP